MPARTRIVLVTAGLSLGCARPGETRPSLPPGHLSHGAAEPGERAAEAVGLASWYGSALAGRRTASGERFDPTLLTAAHRTLPFGTWVEVRALTTGRTVCVRINDRGPNGRAAHRLIDVSRRAAEELGIVHAGVARVELRVAREGQGSCAR